MLQHWDLSTLANNSHNWISLLCDPTYLLHHSLQCLYGDLKGYSHFRSYTLLEPQRVSSSN